MSQGKGDTQRPRHISLSEWHRRYEATFDRRAYFGDTTTQDGAQHADRPLINIVENAVDNYAKA